MTDLNEEDSQTLQIVPSVPVKPAAHLQAVDALLPVPDVPELTGQTSHTAALVAPVVDRKVFTGQEVHAAGPLVVLYVPVSQATHTPASERV